MTKNSNSLTSSGSRKVRRVAAAAAAAAVVFAAVGAVPAAADPRHTGAGTSFAAGVHARGRGELLDVTPVAQLDSGQVDQYLTANGVDGGDVVRHGVSAYRLTYRTITPEGRATTATGLLVLPRGGGRRLDVVADLHGTMTSRTYAPSASDENRMSPYLEASAGRAVAAPDYLGLGEGPGLHPYMDTRSAVTSSVDMLRASRTASQRLGRPMTSRLYVTGFSQGGQVATALGRAVDQGAERDFTLKALAPVSGPYDLIGSEIPALFDGRVNATSGVVYVSYFLTAQNRLRPLYTDPSDVFRAPYDKVVEGLFDTHHGDEEIVGQLPATLKGLLTDDFYRKLQHPEGALLAALKAQDGSCDWKPAAPVRLYAAGGDTDVPIGNAETCARDFASHGVQVPLVDEGDLDHNGGALKAAPQVVRWFNSL